MHNTPGPHPTTINSLYLSHSHSLLPSLTINLLPLPLTPKCSNIPAPFTPTPQTVNFNFNTQSSTQNSSVFHDHPIVSHQTTQAKKLQCFTFS